MIQQIFFENLEELEEISEVERISYSIFRCSLKRFKETNCSGKYSSSLRLESVPYSIALAESAFVRERPAR